jgi:glycosyltransferase involved in cell wall biosynthesis
MPSFDANSQCVENQDIKTATPNSKIAKVLVLSPSLASVGGIQRYTKTLIRALKDELGDQAVRCVTLAEPASHEGKMTQRLSAGSKLIFGWQALKEATRWQPGLIICTHLALGPIAWALANVGRTPYWIVAHGIEAWALLSFGRRRALRHADRVIVISAFTRDLVAKRHQVDLRRISRLPCVLDDGLLRTEPANSGECAQITAERRMVLTVARMAASERYKGHDVMLRSLPSVLTKTPDLSYVVVGDGDDRQRLERLADELGVADHVVFTGGASDSELAALYHQCEVFALPARTVIDDYNPKGEGFGIVFLEAMAFGKPVIGPNSGAPAELIRHGENGLLVDPEDPSSVAEALVNLLTHPEAARKMGKAGREWVRTQYSYSRFREQVRSLCAS